MPARHAVLLTPLECAVPIIILYSKQRQPITPLESALTRLSPATPLECAVPKNLGGGGSFFPFRKQSTPSQRQGPRVYPERSRPKIPTLPERATHHSPQYSSSFFSHSCALFCAFLHSTKTQLSSFQSLPHSLPKNTPGGGTLRLLCPCFLAPSRISHFMLSLVGRSLRTGLGVSSNPSLSTFNCGLSTSSSPFFLWVTEHGSRRFPCLHTSFPSLPPSSITIAALPSGGKMSFSQRFDEIRTGFERPFWVANITELFERVSYYGVQAVLAIYLHEVLKFSDAQAGDLIGYFGLIVWFLPILGGSLADRFGFRRSLAFAYLVLAFGYFLLGSLGASWMAPLRSALPLSWLVRLVLLIPALGPAIVKPCVVGTTARASKENVRSLGYSIYYTLVNVGGTLGPIVAFLVRRSIGMENVFRVCALSVLLMFFGVLFFYREPSRSGEQKVASVAEALRNMFTVLGNLRFMLFLLIFSGFWVVFWQEFIMLPLYIRGYVSSNSDVDLLLTFGPLAVICFQILVSFLTRGVRTFSVLAVVALFAVAIGEMIQSPRYYEYISRLAPPGQQGTYMGYAFLPIGIGFFIAGAIGGRLVHYFGEVLHRPNQMWWVVSGVGVFSTLLMIVYDRIVKPSAQETSS